MYARACAYCAIKLMLGLFGKIELMGDPHQSYNLSFKGKGRLDLNYSYLQNTLPLSSHQLQLNISIQMRTQVF